MHHSCNTNEYYYRIQDEQSQNSKYKSPRVASLDELVYTLEIFLQLPEFLQHVVVDGGVAEDTDTRCQILHHLAHRFILATRRSTRNAQTLQDHGVDAVAVAPDDLHARCLTCVYNVSTLIHRTASRVLLDSKVNNGTSYFDKGSYRKGIRKNQTTSRAKKKKK